jgi:predicted restriction endonuclease
MLTKPQQVVQQGENKEIVALYHIVATINDDVWKNEGKNLKKLTNLFLFVAENHKNAFNKVMQQVAQQGAYKGKGALYWMAAAINDDVWKNEGKNLKEFTSLFLFVAENHKDAFDKAMQQVVQQGEHKGKSALYWMATAINNDVWKNEGKNLKELTSLFRSVAENHKDAFNKAMQQVAQQGAYKGTGALYWMAIAIHNDVWENEGRNLKELINLFLFVAENHKDAFNKAMQQVAQQGEHKGTGALYCMATAINNDILENEGKNIKELIDCLVNMLMPLSKYGISKQQIYVVSHNYRDLLCDKLIKFAKEKNSIKMLGIPILDKIFAVHTRGTFRVGNLFKTTAENHIRKTLAEITKKRNDENDDFLTKAMLLSKFSYEYDKLCIDSVGIICSFFVSPNRYDDSDTHENACFEKGRSICQFVFNELIPKI